MVILVTGRSLLASTVLWLAAAVVVTPVGAEDVVHPKGHLPDGSRLPGVTHCWAASPA